MAAFSTTAILLSIAASTAYAVAKQRAAAKAKAESAAASQTNPSGETDALAVSRANVERQKALPNSGAKKRGSNELVGSAVPRGTPPLIGGEGPLTPPSMPSTAQAGSLAAIDARGAAEKQRKRAAAGGSALSGAYTGKTGPKASLNPKTLIGW